METASLRCLTYNPGGININDMQDVFTVVFVEHDCFLLLQECGLFNSVPEGISERLIILTVDASDPSEDGAECQEPGGRDGRGRRRRGKRGHRARS